MIFNIVLPQPNIKSYKIITFFMAFLNAVSFIFYFLNANTNFLKIICIAGILFSLVLLYIILKKMKAKSRIHKLTAVILILMALCWILAGNFYFFFLFLSLAFFNFITLKPPVISFSAEGIQYPSFPAKIYTWQQVNQVLIKDDVLSIDLTDNKFLQFLLASGSISAATVTDFNCFCEKQITASLSAKKIFFKQ